MDNPQTVFCINADGEYLGGFGGGISSTLKTEEVPAGFIIIDVPLFAEDGSPKLAPVVDDDGKPVLDSEGNPQQVQVMGTRSIPRIEKRETIEETETAPELPEGAIIVSEPPEHAAGALFTGFSVKDGHAVGGKWDYSKAPPAALSQNERITAAMVRAGIANEKQAQAFLDALNGEQS